VTAYYPPGVARRRDRLEADHSWTKIADVGFKPVELTPVEDIAPSTYNPRQVKPERLELVRLSLAKLGWLLPIYADADGEILSGHQRHFVATTMLGATHVPVVRTKKLNMRMRKTLNLIFNRATNDLKGDENSEAISEALLTSDIPAQAAALPDVDRDGPHWFPIMAAEAVDVVKVLDANPIWSDEHGIYMAKRVAKMGQVDIMPIVVTPSGRVVNGMARLTAAGRAGLKQVRAVTISEELADVAYGLLNLLSMRYAMEDTFADELRQNAFKAAPHVRHTMSFNSTFGLRQGKGSSYSFDHTLVDHQDAWLGYYGRSVCDLGAGKLWDARHFEDMGAAVAAFEPWYMLDLATARTAAEEWFFSRIADGRRFDSIFLSNVMNSVPFQYDRLALVTLCAALADEGTTVHATSRTAGGFDSKYVNGSSHTQAAAFSVDYEPRIKISNLHQAPMMQKYHTDPEFAELWHHGFEIVDHADTGTYVWARARRPKPIDPVVLGEAIAHEFDMPWPKAGENFGMADRARQVFSERLGIDIPVVEPKPTEA
jgi:hypothetical protein